MGDDIDSRSRPTLTRTWRNLGDPVSRCDDEFVELIGVSPVKQSDPVNAPVEPEQRTDDYHERVRKMHMENFHKRLANWKNTVRSPGGGGGSGGYCAGWAKLYVAARIANNPGPIIFTEPEEKITSIRISVDELDGWLVEAAVRALPDFNERKALQYCHVFNYPEHWIKTKLLLRATSMRLVMARAENNLRTILAKLENPARILSNAGTDPRPESTDAHVGASLTLEEEAKALIE